MALTIEVPDDVLRFARLAVASRTTRTDGVNLKLRTILIGAGSGMARGDTLERMSKYHGTEWTFERLTAVLEYLAELKAVRRASSGFRAVSWPILEAIAGQVSHATG